MSERGRFIVFEGIDGSGKGTQLERLASALAARGHRVHRTAEPSALPVGALLRQYLRKERVDGMPDFGALALLFAADRLQHCEHEIAPALARGEIVLCDRYDHSSLAYQAALAPDGDSTAAMEWIAVLNARALRPDLVVRLEISPELGLARRASRGGAEELLERAEVQRKVAALYPLAAALRPNDSVLVVDGTPDADTVGASILERVTTALRL